MWTDPFRFRDAVPVDLTASKVLADSIGPHGIRLTTLEIVLPRPYLAEFNTHRALSRNSASSRAIPTEKQIERALNEPYIPTFNGRVKGMGIGEPLSPGEQYAARMKWLNVRDAAVEAARGLLEVDKSRANRVLEPFQWHTCIVSATEWENFLNLRDHEDAQPEFAKLAAMMRGSLAESEPEELRLAEWHLPLWDAETDEADRTNPSILYPAYVSAGRCARVSYDTHWRNEHGSLSEARWKALSAKGHWSPGEHPAVCLPTGERVGNFEGFRQLRKMYANEAIFQG